MSALIDEPVIQEPAAADDLNEEILELREQYLACLRAAGRLTADADRLNQRAESSGAHRNNGEW